MKKIALLLALLCFAAPVHADGGSIPIIIMAGDFEADSLTPVHDGDYTGDGANSGDYGCTPYVLDASEDRGEGDGAGGREGDRQ